MLSQGFKTHLTLYALVNVMLIGIWAASGGGYFWPIWPMLGWGIGVAINGFVVYGGGTDWQRREEEKLRKRMRER